MSDQSSTQVVAAREGWFTLDAEAPHLNGTCCSECGTYYFPPHEGYCRNPACDSEQCEAVALSRRGHIWSYTNACYAPPPPFVAADPHEVFALAAVHLEKENLVVLGQLARGVTVDDVAIGDEVELIVDTLFENDEGRHVVWKWRPTGGQGA